MFDFEKLEVYKKAKIFNADIRLFLKEAKLDPTSKFIQQGRSRSDRRK